MSHDSIGFDSGATDEIKVFRDEGEEIEIENRNQINEIKSSLITEQQGKSSSSPFSSKSSGQSSTSHLTNGSRTLEGPSPFGKFEPSLSYSPFGYHLPEYQQMANKVASMVGSQPPFAMIQQPPPAHMRNFQNLAEKAFWDFYSTQYSLTDAYAQHFPQWPNSMYPLQSPTSFRTPYPSLPPGAFSGFGRSPLMPHAPLSGHSFSPASFLSGNNSPAPSGVSLNGGSTGSSGAKSSGSSRKLANIKQEPLDDPNNNITRSLNNPSSPSSASVSSLKHRNNNDTVHTGQSKKLKATGGGNDVAAIAKSLSAHIQPLTPGSVSLHSPATPGSDLSKQQAHSNLNTNNANNINAHSGAANNNNHNNQPHIKKPLNAFMIYMKEMRPKVIEESTLKESAAINQILGKKWHSLSREEQEIYYEKAKKERELHMELHPGWSAKDNYAINAKKKKKKRERPVDGDRGIFKKCRARYGLEQQNAWCKPCKRKKKCIRYIEAMRQRAAQAANGENVDGLRTESMDDNLGSVGSVDAPTPDSKASSDSEQENIGSSVDVSLSSPTQADSYQSLFNPFQSHFPGTMNGHLSTAASLFYPPPPTSSGTSLSSGALSSLLTPHSPLTAFSSAHSSSLLPPLQAPLTPGQSAPPRNSPFSIEQLARPHRQNSNDRSPPPMTFAGKSSNKSANAISVITQMPTPPSSTDSSGSSATPTMLPVA